MNEPKTEVEASERAADAIDKCCKSFFIENPHVRVRPDTLAQIIASETNCDTLTAQLTHSQATIEAMFKHYGEGSPTLAHKAYMDWKETQS